MVMVRAVATAEEMATARVAMIAMASSGSDADVLWIARHAMRRAMLSGTGESRSPTRAHHSVPVRVSFRRGGLLPRAASIVHMSGGGIPRELDSSWRMPAAQTKRRGSRRGRAAQRVLFVSLLMNSHVV